MNTSTDMKIYCIVEEGWDGMRYSPDDVYCFSSEEKRNAAYERLKESLSYKEADIVLFAFEAELDEDL